MDDDNRLAGASCTVTLDTDAQTLTFEHRGWLLTDEQKATPVAVLPLAVISDIAVKHGRFSSWLRAELRGRTSRATSAATDLYGITCACDPNPFAERVRAAIAAVEPKYFDELPEPEPVEQAAPGWGSRFGRYVGRAMVDGFFNTR